MHIHLQVINMTVKAPTHPVKRLITYKPLRETDHDHDA
jgi:hypothetical protein